jgi:MFS family permease
MPPTAAKRRIVALVYFLLFLGPGIALPYLPRYLQHLGMSDWQIGVAIGLQPILRWASALVFAHAADRWRIRHHLLLACTGWGHSSSCPSWSCGSQDQAHFHL